jgi:YD repeat-containing protein
LLTYGNNVVPVYSYNNRLQMSAASSTIANNGNQYLLYLNYNWGTTNNNGNLRSSSEGYGTSVPYASLSWLSQNYSYDAVNRVTSVSDTGYSRTFGYDAYGNAWVKTNSGVPLAGNTPTSNVFNGNNQIGGGSYDAAGNQTGVNGDTAAYDAESRQSSLTEPASLGSGVENYLYDGNGQRVEKTGPDGATIYVYDAAGRVAAEYGTSGLPSPCTTCYMVTDNLGTARLVTDAGANVISRHDYLPFGEEIAGGTAGLRREMRQSSSGTVRPLAKNQLPTVMFLVEDGRSRKSGGGLCWRATRSGIFCWKLILMRGRGAAFRSSSSLSRLRIRIDFLMPGKTQAGGRQRALLAFKLLR